MDDTSGVPTHRCHSIIFTSKIIRYIIITFIVLTVLVFLLKKNHFDAAIEYIQQNSNFYGKVKGQIYQNDVNTTVGNCGVKHFLDGFTLIMQTYRRTDLLMRLLKHYSTMPRLHKIIVVWNNIGVKPPVKDWKKHAPHPVPVVFLPQDKNTIRNRLKSFKEIETEGLLAR